MMGLYLPRTLVDNACSNILFSKFENSKLEPKTTILPRCQLLVEFHSLKYKIGPSHNENSMLKLIFRLPHPSVNPIMKRRINIGSFCSSRKDLFFKFLERKWSLINEILENYRQSTGRAAS